MGMAMMIAPFPWMRYSKKLKATIDQPEHGGSIEPARAEGLGMRLVKGGDGEVSDGNVVQLYWLVDPANGEIIEARFQVYGQSALIGAAEEACRLVEHKNYDQAKRIGADLIDKELRDKVDVPAFPPETFPHLNMVVDAIVQAAESCLDIPLADHYVAPPAPTEIGEVIEGGYPGFDALPLKKKIAVIEEVLDREVRPYIALDGGGVEVMDLVNNREVVVSYKGNCTSCFSSTGATLSYIQQMLRAKVHPDLQVIPNL